MMAGFSLVRDGAAFQEAASRRIYSCAAIRHYYSRFSAISACPTGQWPTFTPTKIFVGEHAAEDIGATLIL